MSVPLRVLLLEDRPEDAALELYELHRAGFAPLQQRVETETDYLAALDPALDLILADYALPQFDALRALELLRERGLDIPFIIVSGTIGEEIAVRAMQQGAADYLLKDRLARLGAAVKRALEQRRMRAEARRATAALHAAELKYRTLVEHIPAIVYMAALDEGSSTLYVNPQIETLLGFSPGEWLADPQRWRRQLHPLDLDKVLADLARTRAGAGPIHSEFRMLARDRRVVWFRHEAVVVHDDEGQPLFLQGVMLDITERRRLEAQFLQAQKMESVGQLAGGVAHDFNNLLTAINGYAVLSLSDLPAGSQLRADLEEIVRAADRATVLTRQLLAFARKQVIEPRVLDLNELVAGIEKLLRRLLGEGVALATELAPDLGQVKADPGQIEQVLVNLAVNARDAMPEGGRLTIATRNTLLDQGAAGAHQGLAPGPYALIAISDTGSGIDPELQQRIFEPFFTTKGPGRGTGLGLSTCYGIVKQHGGHIWVASEPGRGATFTICLPQVAAAIEPSSEHAAEGALPRGSETVLLAEDNEAVRAMAARVLREQGYTVLEAADGAAALGVAEARGDAPIDLLLTDLVMPQLNGMALFRQLNARWPGLKVIFVSGYADDVLGHQGPLERDLTLLHKPFTPARLARAVREALDAGQEGIAGRLAL